MIGPNQAAPQDRDTTPKEDERDKRAMLCVPNAFIRIETRPVAGGADVRIVARRGHIIAPEIDRETGEVAIHLRKDVGPRIGETIMVGHRAVIVADRRWNSHGRLQVLDEDTHTWTEVGR